MTKPSACSLTQLGVGPFEYFQGKSYLKASHTQVGRHWQKKYFKVFTHQLGEKV